MSKWTETEISFLRKNVHLTYDELAEKLNRTAYAVRFQFRKNKIKKIKAPHKIYNVNEEFFKSWTSEMAYILGFAFADGSIRKRQGNSTRFRLCNSDFKLLGEIKVIMESSHRITTDKRTGTDYYLDITSLQIVEDLEKLGMTENNSRTMKFPFIPDEFFFPFIRGYFDGDGHVKVSGKKGRKIRIIFASGSKSFLTSFKQKLEQRGITCSIRTLRKGEKNESYQVSVLKNGRKLFYHGLYGPNPEKFEGIRMERKYQILIEYFETNIKRNCEDCSKVFEVKANTHVLCTSCAKERDRIRKRKPDGYYQKQVKCPDCGTSFVKKSHNHVRCKDCARKRDLLQKKVNHRRTKQ